MDINCAHDNEPWEVYGLLHEGVDYLTPEQAGQLGVTSDFDLVSKMTTAAESGDRDAAKQRVSRAVHDAVLSGKGCPNSTCGFQHEGPGQYREEQMRQIVVDGVTDEDPIKFL